MSPTRGPLRRGLLGKDDEEAAMKQRTCSSWSEFRHPTRPRLLIEDPSPALEVAEFRRFEEAGFEVALCSGPNESCGCPLVDGYDCWLVEQADVVLMGPGMADHRAEVAAAIQHRRPGLPIVAQMPRADSGPCPPGCMPSYFPISVDGQIRSLWRALDRPNIPHPSAGKRPQGGPARDLRP